MTFAPGFMGKPNASPVTWTYVNGANSNTASCSLPAGSAAGDVAFFFDNARNTALPTTTVPAGWTTVSNQSLTGSPSGRTTISYKILNASDISAGSISGMSGYTTMRKAIGSFRPSRAISGVTIASLLEQAISTTPTTQTIVAGAAPIVLIGSACGQASGSFSPSGTLTTSGTLIDSSSITEVYYELQNVTAANRTLGMADSGSYNILQSFVFSGL